MKNLKPCPNVLCGKKVTENDVLQSREAYGQEYVCCPFCGCRGQTAYFKKEAIDAWNTRPETGLQKLQQWAIENVKEGDPDVDIKIGEKIEEFLEQEQAND